jgi:hypothetical protein
MRMALSRRLFIGSSAGAAAAATVLVTQGLSGGSTAAADVQGNTGGSTATETDDDITGVGTMIHVRNADAGEVVIMKDHQETVVVDRKLVAAIARATRNGKI